MKEFILAALPWVLTGVPIASVCAGLPRTGSKEGTNRRGQRMAAGMALGLLWGVALNSLNLWENHALGFAIGPLWGMALATLWREPEENEHEE